MRSKSSRRDRRPLEPGTVGAAAPLIDEAIARYLEWRRACDSVRATYRAWTGPASEDRRMASAVYNAALSREERAAGMYAAAIRALQGLLWPEPQVEYSGSPASPAGMSPDAVTQR